MQFINLHIAFNLTNIMLPNVMTECYGKVFKMQAQDKTEHF